MSNRVVALVPSVGRAEFLPSHVSPTDVLTAGPVLNHTFAPGKEVFWSTGSYHLHEVNEFASAVVGHTVKGDACVVHTGDGGDSTGNVSVHETLENWRWVAKVRRKMNSSGVEITPVEVDEASFDSQQVVTSLAVETAPKEQVEAKQETIPAVDAHELEDLACASAAGNSTPESHSSSFPTSHPVDDVFMTIEAEEGETAVAPKLPPANNMESHPRSFASIFPYNMPKRFFQNQGERKRQGERVVDLYSDMFGTSVGVLGPDKNDLHRAGEATLSWDDIHPDILGRIAKIGQSGGMLLMMAAVSSQWKKALVENTGLLRDMPFQLNQARPLRYVCPCCVMVETTLQRRHIGNVPSIVLKASELQNRSAALSLANLYEACGMFAKAVQHWRKLSILGDMKGSWKYGEALYNGKGIGRDMESAQQVLLRVGKQILKGEGPNDKEMSRGVGICLGYMFLDGDAGEPDNEKAVKWFKIAADNGSDEAEVTLGWMFNTGQYG